MAEEKKIASNQGDREKTAKAGAIKNKSAKKKPAKRSSTVKTDGKKKSAKKAAAKKSTARKSAGKKSASKKTATSKKTAVKKTSAKKKAVAKKQASKVTAIADTAGEQKASGVQNDNTEKSPVNSTDTDNVGITSDQTITAESHRQNQQPDSEVSANQPDQAENESEAAESSKHEHMPAVAAALDRGRSRSRSVFPMLLILAILVAGGAVFARYWAASGEDASATYDAFVSRISTGMSDALASARNALGVEERDTDPQEQVADSANEKDGEELTEAGAIETVAVLSGVVDTGLVNAEPFQSDLNADATAATPAIVSEITSAEASDQATVDTINTEITTAEDVTSESSVDNTAESLTKGTQISETPVSEVNPDPVAKPVSDMAASETLPVQPLKMPASGANDTGVESGQSESVNRPAYNTTTQPVYYYPQPRLPVSGNMPVQPRAITPPWPYPGYGYAPVPYPRYYNPGAYYPPSRIMPQISQPATTVGQ